MRMIEEQNHWVIPIQGRKVTRCLVDFAFGLELWMPDDVINIQIESTFILQLQNDQHQLTPGHQPEALGVALSMLHKTVVTAQAYKDGSLAIRFSDGIYLSVSADPDYEAWQISGPGGLLLVCMPGGRLAVWQPV